MSTASIEAFDGQVRGKYTQWILPSCDSCTLPRGFQDQVLSVKPQLQLQILLLGRQDSKGWLISNNWDLTFIPEVTTDWSLLLSLMQHLKKPALIVATPGCKVPEAFWSKCLSFPAPVPTCVSLRVLSSDQLNLQTPGVPSTVFFPSLQDISEIDFLKMPGLLVPAAMKSFEALDLRTLYRELRGAGASLCMSQTDSRSIISALPFNAMWFYPEINGALRLPLSELRKILQTITDRLLESS